MSTPFPQSLRFPCPPSPWPPTLLSVRRTWQRVSPRGQSMPIANWNPPTTVVHQFLAVFLPVLPQFVCFPSFSAIFTRFSPIFALFPPFVGSCPLFHGQGAGAPPKPSFFAFFPAAQRRPKSPCPSVLVRLSRPARAGRDARPCGCSHRPHQHHPASTHGASAPGGSAAKDFVKTRGFHGKISVPLNPNDFSVCRASRVCGMAVGGFFGRLAGFSRSHMALRPKDVAARQRILQKRGVFPAK